MRNMGFDKKFYGGFIMNNENIMENNEVLEVAEDMVKTKSISGLKLAGGALVLAGIIYGGYKLVRKIKARKEEDTVESTNYIVVDNDDDVEEVE